jgi:hypothetical protein
MKLRPTACILATSMLAAWIHPVGYLQAVRWASPKFGTAKSLAFCLVLRWHWLPAWPEAKANTAAVDSEALVAFEPAVNSSPRRAFLFIPGALVEPYSYAPILGRLANASGMLCVCVKPVFRHPALWASDDEQALAVMRQFPHIKTWTIGGHSMGGGGYGAALVAARLLSRGPRIMESSVDARIDGLVMWAAVITSSTGVDLSGSQMRSVVILGSEDSVVPPEGTVEDGSLTRDNLRRFGAPTTKLVVVQGGNHGGFGHYGPQTFPRLDNPRTISLEEQQAQVIKHTAAFLRA